MKARVWTPLVMLAGLASGCGTVCNLGGGLVHPESEPKIYGGVQRDAEVYASFFPLHSEPQSMHGDGKGALFLVGLFFLDPTLSLIGDTFTLPVTVPLQLCRENAEEQARRARSSADQSAPLATVPPDSAEIGSSAAPPAQEK